MGTTPVLGEATGDSGEARLHVVDDEPTILELLSGLGITGLKIDGAAKVCHRLVVAPHISEGPGAVGDARVARIHAVASA